MIHKNETTKGPIMDRIWPGARRVKEGEATRPLTVGERALFAAGGPLAFTVVLTDAGYRALV